MPTNSKQLVDSGTLFIVIVKGLKIKQKEEWIIEKCILCFLIHCIFHVFYIKILLECEKEKGIGF